MTKALFHLLHLSDPALPIGGFSHSAGLETYVQKGVVHDKDTATAFIEAQLSYNIGFTDAAFVSLAWDAARHADFDTLCRLDEECHAVKIPREIREASQKLGGRLLKIFDRSAGTETGKKYRQAVSEGKTPGHYAIAFGICGALLDLPKEELLVGFFYNAASGMVTNCVKLIPLGQQEGREMLFAMQERIELLAQESLEPDKEKIGYCCAGFDIRSMQHERLYSRLYMS